MSAGYLTVPLAVMRIVSAVRRSRFVSSHSTVAGKVNSDGAPLVEGLCEDWSQAGVLKKITIIAVSLRAVVVEIFMKSVSIRKEI